MPLVDTLHRAVLARRHRGRAQGKAIDAVAVTASSTLWTFCHTARDRRQETWNRPGPAGRVPADHHRAPDGVQRHPLPVSRHPAVGGWPAGVFGDGSMRQMSPLSPAVHLGAHKCWWWAVGQPQRSGFRRHRSRGMPSMGGIAGHAMASVFHDTLKADVEQTQRIARTLCQLPREVAAVLPYRSGLKCWRSSPPSRSTRWRWPRPAAAVGAPRARRPGRAQGRRRLDRQLPAVRAGASCRR